MIENFEIEGYMLYIITLKTDSKEYDYKPKITAKVLSVFICNENFKLEDFINNKDKHLTITI